MHPAGGAIPLHHAGIGWGVPGRLWVCFIRAAARLELLARLQAPQISLFEMGREGEARGSYTVATTQLLARNA